MKRNSQALTAACYRSLSSSRSRSPYSRSPSPRGKRRADSRSPPPRRRSPVRRSRSPPRRRSGDDEDPDRQKTVTITHLTKNVTDKHLEEIFGAYGEIKKVDMPLNRRSKPTSQYRGTSYILTTAARSQCAQRFRSCSLLEYCRCPKSNRIHGSRAARRQSAQREHQTSR